MADLRSGTMAWTCPYRTFDKRPQVNQAAIVENKRLGPVLAYIAEKQKELDMSAVGQGNRGGVASAITCSTSDRPEQGRLGGGCAIWGSARHPRRHPFTPQPGKAATTTPQTVTFVTGAKSDFSKWL